MLTSWPFCIGIGCVLGFLSGLGAGGGSLLILWLTLIVGMEAEIARSINLMFFLPCALIACLFRWKQGTLSIPKVLPAVIAGCLCAAVCTWLNAGNLPLLRKAFGVLLIITGIRELMTKK